MADPFTTVTPPDLPALAQVDGSELVAVWRNGRLAKMPQRDLRGTKTFSGAGTPPYEASRLFVMQVSLGDRWRDTNTRDEYKLIALDPVAWSFDGNVGGGKGDKGDPGTGISPKGQFATTADLPSMGLPGDLYISVADDTVIPPAFLAGDGAMYVATGGTFGPGNRYRNIGPFRGPPGATTAEGLDDATPAFKSLNVEDPSAPGNPVGDGIADAATKAALSGVTDFGRPVTNNPNWNWATLRSGAARYQVSNGSYEITKLLPGGGEYGAPSTIAGFMTIPSLADQNTDGSNPLLIICAPVSGTIVTYSSQAAAVALFGMARVNVSQGRVWGANLVTANWPTAGSQARTPFNCQMNGLEIDCSLDTPTSGWAGSNCDGIWIPAGHYGVAIDGGYNCIHTGIYGTIPFKNGWRLDHGSCINVMEIGKANKTGTSNSMRDFLIARDPSGQDVFMTRYLDPSNSVVQRPINTSSLGKSGYKVQDAGGNDRAVLSEEGRLLLSSGAGGGLASIGSTDGGANDEILQFKTGFATTAGNKVTATLRAAPDVSGGRALIHTLGQDGLLKECLRADSQQNVTIGRNSAAGPERLNVSGNIAPVTPNTGTLGVPSAPWQSAYFQTAATTTSDIRLKRLRGAPDLDAWDDQNAHSGEFSDAELDAWAEVRFRVYQMRNAIELKGEDKARLHFGLIVQEVEAAFRRHGVDPARLALWLVTPLYGTRKAMETQRVPTGRTITRKVLGENGEPMRETVPTGENANEERLSVKSRERALAASIIEFEPGGEDFLKRLAEMKESDAELAGLNEALAQRCATMVPTVEIDVEETVEEFETVEVEINEQYDTGETRLALRYDHAFAIEGAWSRREMTRLSARLDALERKASA